MITGLPSCGEFSEIVRKTLESPADLVTFTDEILNGNFHFVCSGCSGN